MPNELTELSETEIRQLMPLKDGVAKICVNRFGLYPGAVYLQDRDGAWTRLRARGVDIAPRFDAIVFIAAIALLHTIGTIIGVTTMGLRGRTARNSKLLVAVASIFSREEARNRYG